MTNLQDGLSANLSVTAGIESKLSSALKQTAGEVARLESLDEEQRAEVYAILRAIQLDTAVHHEMAATMKSPQLGETPNA